MIRTDKLAVTTQTCMKRIFAVLPILFLMSCSQRVYYRTIDPVPSSSAEGGWNEDNSNQMEEGRQRFDEVMNPRAGKLEITSIPAAETEIQPAGPEDIDTSATLAMPPSTHDVQDASGSALPIESGNRSHAEAESSTDAMDWDTFTGNILPEYDAFRKAWHEREEEWEDELFTLRATSPVFEPKSAFETEEAYRKRRGQALAALRGERTAFFEELSLQKADWMNKSIHLRGTITLNPDDYDTTEGQWKYLLQSGPDDGGIIRSGWWSIEADDAGEWSRTNPTGTTEVVLEVLWTRSGVPQIVRAEGAGFNLEPQGAVHTKQNIITRSGWAWYDNGLLAGSSFPEPQPWGPESSGFPSVPKTAYSQSIFQSSNEAIVATLKDHPRGKNTYAAPEDILFLMEGLEFNISGWREIQDMDISDDGSTILISGAFWKTTDHGQSYPQWMCLAVNLITGITEQIGNLGGNANNTDRPCSQGVCLHPDQPLAVMINPPWRYFSGGNHGVYSWNPEVTGSVKASAEIPDWACRVSRDMRGNFFLLHDFNGRIQLNTFESNPRKLAEWSCQVGLLEAIPSSDGRHIITLETNKLKPSNDHGFTEGPARVRIRKASNGKVLWSTPLFDIQTFMGSGQELVKGRLKVNGNECVVTEMKGSGNTEAGLFLLPFNFNEE